MMPVVYVGKKKLKHSCIIFKRKQTWEWRLSCRECCFGFSSQEISQR